MNPVIEHSFTRYLAAKKSIDDRSLNRHVWGGLSREIGASDAGAPYRILEVGAGIGTMVDRVLEWDLFSGLKNASAGPVEVNFTLVDDQPENCREMRRRLESLGSGPSTSLEDPGSLIHVERSDLNISVTIEAADLFGYLDREREQTWDLLIAQALLDTVHLPSALPALLRVLRPGGLFLFSINFDGCTIFQPEIGSQDDIIAALYHQTMDERVIDGLASGDSRTGRHLYHRIQAAGAEVLAMGASDHVICAGTDGYLDDDAYFLHFIVNTVERSLSGHPELSRSDFDAWVEQRHKQIDRHELVYIAHQLDVLGRRPDLRARA